MSPAPASALARLAALLAGLAIAGAAPAQSVVRDPEAAAIQRLMAEGRSAEALARIGRALAARPGDAELRFLQGVALARERRDDEAIEVLAGLTRDHPDLAEPYNNLAVLYAARGRYGEAREALEMAVRNRPGYATAHENLGDIHARIAAESYRRARELEPRRRGIDAKLAALRTVFTATPAAAAASAAEAPGTAAAAASSAGAAPAAAR